MKKLSLLSLVTILLLINILLTNCRKETSLSQTTTTTKANTKEASVPNQFIWNSLHDYYLWVDQVPNLSGPKFSIKDSLNAFLNQYTDPSKLFYDLLYKYQTIDKWSFIVNDSTTIKDWIAGVSTTVGYDYDLYEAGTTNNIFGVVRYVLKGSPADLAGVRRGDIFIQINNQQLTISNYQTLLNSFTTFTLSFATIINNVITPNGRSVSLTAVTMQENPILLDTVLVVNGANVGYLVYNAFNSDFDIQLNDVFKYFKDQGISKLILDLRYNGGGSIQSAIYLASMIYGTNTTKDFIKSQYNTALQAYYVQTYGAAALQDNFTDNILATGTTPKTAINTVDMSKLYVITTDNTASASELTINGLKPYLSLTQVGDTTVGKYVGSITLQDVDAKGNVNPQDPWTMQPIVVKIFNSLDVSDYVKGLAPNILASEDITNLLPFGNPNETLLKAVLNDMQGLPQKSAAIKYGLIGTKKIADSKNFKPFSKDMYLKRKYPAPPTHLK
jgi:carboxyl-terminal processing protease